MPATVIDVLRRHAAAHETPTVPAPTTPAASIMPRSEWSIEPAAVTRYGNMFAAACAAHGCDTLGKRESQGAQRAAHRAPAGPIRGFAPHRPQSRARACRRTCC